MPASEADSPAAERRWAAFAQKYGRAGTSRLYRMKKLLTDNNTRVILYIMKKNMIYIIKLRNILELIL